MLGIQPQSFLQWIKVNIFITNSVLKINYRIKKQQKTPHTFNLKSTLKETDYKCT